MPIAQRPVQEPVHSSRRWTIIALLNAGMIIAYVSRSNLPVALALPDFIKSFHLSDVDRGTLNSAFFWAYAALQIPAGWIVDRYGVKWPYALSFLFWCIASAGTVFTRSVAQLTALRVILGVGESVVAPASYKWIRFNFEEKERGLAVGLYMAGTKIGPAIGPPLAVWLIVHYDWRMMFLILGLGGLVWLIPWIALVQNDARRPAKDESKAPASPIGFGRLLASPVVWGTVIATFCYMYFVYFCMTWMPAYFVEQRHQSLAKMGLYTFYSFAGMAVMAALGGWAADWMIRRGGNPVTVRKWFTIAGFVIACTELIGARASSLTMAVTFAIISLSGLGLATANYWAITQTLFPAATIGRMAGVQNCAASVAGIVAPIASGWLKQRTGSYEAPMNAIWIVLIVGILSYLTMVREKYAPVVTE
ncbi:MAG TPA: MFS transporter [Bryobacteraceae bacterium]|nr:MFS transporter [Bryobacteraceae bacterium]